MEKFNGAYKHGRYEQIQSDTSREMSNVNVFATQDGPTAGGQRPAGQRPNEDDRLHISISYSYHMFDNFTCNV